MKIYNKLVISMITGEVLEEDSFDYNGQMILARGEQKKALDKTEYEAQQEKLRADQIRDSQLQQQDQLRGQIMPINRRYNVETLLAAGDYYVSRKKQRLTFEYILIAGVNDSDEQARLLARHAKRLSAKVNLIPYNTVHGLPWSRPSQDRQETFLSILRERGVAATLRREKGNDIDAACGQLRLQTKRELETATP